MKKPKPRKKGSGDSGAKAAGQEPKTIALSCLLGVGVAFAILAAMSLVMTLVDLPHGAMMPVTILAVVSGCFAAGFSCGKMLRRKGLLYGLICGSLLFLLALVCEVALIGEEFSVLLLYKYVMYIASAMIGGVLGVNQRRKVR